MNSPTLTRSATFVALLTLGTAARADLYANRTGIGQQTGIIRFSDVTGAFINLVTPLAEDYGGVEVAPTHEVLALNNTLGYVSVHRFSADLTMRTDFGPAHPPVGPSLYYKNSGLTLDPLGNVFVASTAYDHNPFLSGSGNPGPGITGIFKLDASTGQLSGAIPFAAAPGMNQPYDLQFSPAGHLFVSDRSLGVLEFDGGSGTYLRTLVPAEPGRLSDVTGISWGPDGNLYVASAANNSVLRYDLTAGTLNIFVAPGAGGLVNPADIDFGPDGNLYVADRGANTVRRYRGSDGESLGQFTPAGFGLFGTGGPTFLSFTGIPENSVSGPTAALLGLAVFGLWSGFRGASKDANS